VKAIFKHLRLLPAVILLGSGLLVIKGIGLARDARAESAAPAAQTAAPQAPTAQPSPGDDPAEDDSESASAAQVDVLTSLAHRRAELDSETQSLATRENLLAAAEARVDGKIDQLKKLQSDIQALLGQRDAAEEQQVQALVKTYSSMKPKDAARIFNTLDDRVLLAVAQEMKPDVLGAVLAAMDPGAAQKLTVKLADRLKLPAEEKLETLAAATPPPASPASTIGAPNAPVAASGSVTVPQAQAAPAAAPTAAAPAETSPPAKAPAAKAGG